MDESVRKALATDRVVDITTTGRRTGAPQRVEIWIHEVEGRYFITGRPGRRSWYANLRANPNLTVHVKRSASADLPGRARAVTDPREKRDALLSMPALAEFLTGDSVDEWVAGSPVVVVEFD
jgi:deazaflavin-dependent oxidoreductase (nitroreductase family)